MDSGTERWILRYRNFANALEQLHQACDLESYSKLERAGLVQTFVFTCELAWKTLKELLDALNKHNLLALTYSEEAALLIGDRIRKRYFPALEGLEGALKARLDP